MEDNRNVHNVTPAVSPVEGPARPQNARPTIGWLAQAEVNTLNTAMWSGADEAARAQGVNLLFVPGDSLNSPMGYQAQSNVLYDLIGADSLDGLLVWGGLLSQYIAIDEFKAFCEQYQPLPLVNVGMALEGFPSVWVDNYIGMRDAIRHLVDVHGYHRIAFIRGVGGPEAEERYRAYTDVLAEHDIPLDLDLVTPPSNQQRADGEAGIRALLDERKVDFEAVVASTDAMALGAMDELKRRGFRVPGDVAVVGFDDVEEAAVTSPPLTTVRQPFHALVKRGAEILCALIAGEEAPQQVTLPTELVIRQSCGCLDAAVVEATCLETPSVDRSQHDASSAHREPRRKAGTFEDRFAARRREIVSDMERAAGPDLPLPGPGWAHRLLDSLVLDMQGQTTGIFVSDLNRTLQPVADGDGNVAAWQGVLSALRRRIVPLLDDNSQALLHCEDLFQQGRVTVAAAAEHARAAGAYVVQRQADMLQEAGQVLFTAANMDDLLAALAQELPKVGVPSCYISLYERPESPAAGAKLILALDDRGRIDLEEVSFPSRELVPGHLLDRRDRYTMSLEPLYYRESQFGFALLEVGPSQPQVREQLRLHLNSALQKALLVDYMAEHARKLQTAAEVSHTVASILEPRDLMQQVVELIRDRFGLYYVGLFLVAEADSQVPDDGANLGPGQQAVLQAGTGKAGRQMVTAKHRLAVGGDSMIGRCVAEGQARIALDVGKEAIHFDNPLLPETRSEMALPLISRGQVIGALTVQSNRRAAFTDEDISSLQVMALQVAVALENAHLLQDTRQAALELESERRQLRTLVDSLPDNVFIKDAGSRFVVNNLAHLRLLGLTSQEEAVGKTDFDFFPEELATQYYADEQAIVQSGQPLVEREEPTLTPDGETQWLLTSKVPLVDVSGKVTGLVGINRDITGRKEAQMALERHTTLLEAAAQVSRAASSLLDVDTLLEQTVNLIRDEFDYYYVGLFLMDSETQSVRLRAGTGEAGQAMLEREHQFEIGSQSMIGSCVADGKARVAMDVGEEEVRFDNPLLPETRSEMALPLISRGQVLGALTVQSSQAAAFSEEDVTVLQSMADQLANAIANARLYAQVQQAAQRSQALFETSRALSTQVEEEPLLRTILEAIYRTLKCEHVSISTVDEEAKTISLRHIYYQGEFDLFPEWIEQASYSLDHPDIVADIYRTGRTEIIGEWDERFNREIWEQYNHERYLRIFAPIKMRDRVLGVIEVAYDKRNKVSVADDEVELLAAFIDQTASALQQARLLERTQAALSDLEATQRRYMRLAWTDYTLSRESISGYVLTGEEEGPTADDWLPQMTTAVQKRDAVTDQDARLGSTLALPLTVHGEVIGALGGYREDVEEWSQETLAAVQDIAEQMALALENQRLFDEEARSRHLLDQRVKELDCLGDIGRRIDELPSIPDFLEWVTMRVPSAMQHPDLCLVAIGFHDEVYGAAEAMDLPCQITQGFQVAGQQVGRVCIAYREERGFLDEESALMGDISRRVGGYIENRSLLRQEQMRAEEQATLRRITEVVSRSLEMQGLLAASVETLRQALSFDAVLISLTDEDTRSLYLAAEEGLPEALARTLEQDGMEGTLCDHVFQTGHTTDISDLRQGAPLDVGGLIKQGLLSYAGVPIEYLGDRLGTICCFNKSVRLFSTNELSLLEGIGDQIGVGVANARLFAETQAALAEVEATHRSYLRQAWQDHLRQREILDSSGFLYDESHAERPEDVRVVPDLWLPEMERVLTEGAVVTSSQGDDGGQRTGLALPITIRGETIGVLGVESPGGDHKWTDEERALVEAVGDQLGQALEGARLFADTRRRAERERLIGEITTKIRASTDIRAILQTTAEELGQALGTSRASVRIEARRPIEGLVESSVDGVPVPGSKNESPPPASQPAEEASAHDE